MSATNKEADAGPTSDRRRSPSPSSTPGAAGAHLLQPVVAAVPLPGTVVPDVDPAMDPVPVRPEGLVVPPPPTVEAPLIQPVAEEPSVRPSLVSASPPTTSSFRRALVVPGAKRARDDGKLLGSSALQRKVPWTGAPRPNLRKILKK